MSTVFSSQRVGLTAVAALVFAGCTKPPPSTPDVPEPEQALRPAQLRGEIPEEAKIADYELFARLDGDEHRIDGRAVLTWRNRTRRTVSELPFHLYMNGFRAEDTAWMKTARGSHRGQTQDEDFAWGYIDVTAVRMLGDAPLDLDHAEAEDPSVMNVTLPRPVEPEQSIVLELEFVTQLPRVFARTGFHRDFHMVGQWYPKIGVLEEAGGWKVHVFTLNDEFFADFGNYDVHLDVPETMIVGASGIRMAEVVEDGRRKLDYRAEMVHDFAWTAHPNFIVRDGEHEGIRIRQLIQPEHVTDADDHLQAQISALRSFEDRYGPYPWSTITIVHPPDGAGGAGGMEYPTLYTTSDRLRIPELVRRHVFDERFSGLFTTVHEFGHQYFQGLLASNEHEQPWLDEGMNTMADLLAYVDAYGENGWVVRLAGHEIGVRAAARIMVSRSAMLDPIDQAADEFHPDVGTYGGTVYSKTAAGMLTLRNLVGDAAFREALHLYGMRWRFRHPTGDDLQAVLREVLGPRVALEGFSAAEGEADVRLDLDGYMQQLLHEVSAADFRIHSIRNRRRLGTAGWHRDGSGELVGGEAPKNLSSKVSALQDEDVEAVLVVAREGEFRVPVEVLVEFADGSRERLVWDGESRYRVLTFPGKRVRLAALDPESKLLIEFDRTDNVGYAPDANHDGGIDEVLGGLAQAVSIAILGGIGP